MKVCPFSPHLAVIAHLGERAPMVGDDLDRGCGEA